jgi:hypothetical protein
LRILRALHVALQELGATLGDIPTARGAADSSGARRQLLERLRMRAHCSLAATARSLDWIERALEGLDQGHAV